MIRKFNYTKRIKIPRDLIQISIKSTAGVRRFNADLNLSEFNFPSEAKIFLEAYFKDMRQRFNFGTVSNPQIPQDTSLSELPDSIVIYFRVLVVDESEETGKIIGKAEEIIAVCDDDQKNRLPILPVNPADLNQQIWKMTFDYNCGGRPILEVNRTIPDIMNIVKNDINFVCLVFPIALRQVLEKIVIENDYDDEESWTADWFRFLRIQLGITDYPEKEDDNEDITPDQDLWIDKCVNKYCELLNLMEKYKRHEQ